MLRAFSAAALLLAAASAFAQAPVAQMDMERAGGTYLSLPAASAQACATQCARDGLCLTWTYTPRSCALKAVVTPALAKQGAVSGLAPRAPQFAALVGQKEPLSPIPAPFTGAPSLAPPQTAAITAAAAPVAFETNRAAPDALHRLVPAPPEKIATAPAAAPDALGYTWAAPASATLNAKVPAASAPAAPAAQTQIAWLAPRLPLDVSPKPAAAAKSISVTSDKIELDEELLGGPDDAF